MTFPFPFIRLSTRGSAFTALCHPCKPLLPLFFAPLSGTKQRSVLRYLLAIRTRSRVVSDRQRRQACRAPWRLSPRSAGGTADTPRISLWNCSRKSFDEAPPSTRIFPDRVPPRRCSIAVQYIGGLICHRFQCRAHDVVCRCRAGQPLNRAARKGVPVRCAQPDKRRYQVNAGAVREPPVAICFGLAGMSQTGAARPAAIG